MVKRRSMVVGLGALATGSGAIFSSAAFASTVSPSADMRVVVGQDFGNNLRVEAGDIFRLPNGNFAPSSDSSAVKTVHDTSSTNFFGGNNELDDLEVDDLPAAGANDEYNNALSLAVATAVGETATIGNDNAGNVGFIQIENNTPDEHDIQIEFDSFGEDVGNASGKVTKEQVREIYKFYDSGGEQISKNGFGNIPNSLPVGSGTTEQIYLEVDTDSTDLYNAVMSATSTNDSQFTEEQDTVDLVENIRVGVDEEDE